MRQGGLPSPGPQGMLGKEGVARGQWQKEMCAGGGVYTSRASDENAPVGVGEGCRGGNCTCVRREGKQLDVAILQITQVAFTPRAEEGAAISLINW